MKLLVLAFENLEDLPENWKQYSEIDAYGFSEVSVEEISKLPVKLRLCRQFFEIKDYVKPKIPYDLCFIRHPDPWGEPRNWMQAIAALGESLRGNLVCEFWFPHEIIAFDFLLKSILEKSSANFLEAKRLPNVNTWSNFQASWQINERDLKKNMLDIYKNNKTKILQQFYNKTGKLFDPDKSIEEVLKIIS